MSGNVDVRHPVVHHIRALYVQRVDHARHAALVSGDRARRDDHRIARADVQLVRGVRHAKESAHRLALAARRHHADHAVRQVFELLDPHDPVVRDVQIAELLRVFHDLLHASALEADDASVLDRHVGDLLDAVHVRRERRHDHASLRLVEALLEGLADLLFALRKARAFDVRAVGEQRQYAPGSVIREPVDVDRFAVDRRHVDLEVARVNQRADRRADRKRHRARDRVSRLDELHTETAERNGLSRIDVDHFDVGKMMLIQLVPDKRVGKPRAVDRAAEPFHCIRDRADMVLVTVRDTHAANAIRVLFEVSHVGDDHVDPRHLLVRKDQAAVDDENVVLILDHGHVFADLSHPAQRDDSEFMLHKVLSIRFFRRRTGCRRCSYRTCVRPSSCRATDCRRTECSPADRGCRRRRCPARRP